MKKLSSIAAAAALALTSGAASAGGIQLNFDNPGSIGGSVFFDAFANSPPYGSALANQVFTAGPGSGPGGTGYFIAQSAVGPINVQGQNGFLTYQLVIPVSSSAPNATTLRLSNRNALAPNGYVLGSQFDLFFTPTAAFTNTSTINGSVYGQKRFDESTGLFLPDVALLAGQIKLATGTARFNPVTAFGQLNIADLGNPDSTLASNADPGEDFGALGVETINTNPSSQVQIDFTFKAPEVVNNLTGLAIDLQQGSQGFTPYNTGATGPNGTLNDIAANRLLGVTPDFGVDTGTTGKLHNDFTCGLLSVSKCDFEFQIGGSYTFLAERVPEPASLLLVGSVLVGLGWTARRRTTSAA